jgi:hypothetical protein
MTFLFAGYGALVTAVAGVSLPAPKLPLFRPQKINNNAPQMQMEMFDLPHQ